MFIFKVENCLVTYFQLHTLIVNIITMNCENNTDNIKTYMLCMLVITYCYFMFYFMIYCSVNHQKKHYLYFLLFLDDQLRKGGFLCYVLFGVYLFTLLGFICNDYFIPCVENICEDLKIPKVSILGGKHSWR